MTTNEENLPAIAKKAEVPIKNGQFAPNDFDGLYRLANIMCKSGMVPKAYEGKVESTFVAMQMGMEIGMSFMSALQNIAVVNGKPTLYADGVTAMLQGRKQLESIEEWYEADGEKVDPSDLPMDLNSWPNVKAISILKRVGQDNPYRGSFSVNDAKRAGRWNPEKGGVWKAYPARMLMWRARTFPARDGFSDCLHGIGIFEEQIDINDAERAIDVTPEHIKPEEKPSVSVKDLEEQIDKFCVDENIHPSDFRNWIDESAKLNSQTFEETWVDFLANKVAYMDLYITHIEKLEAERMEDVVDGELDESDKAAIEQMAAEEGPVSESMGSPEEDRDTTPVSTRSDGRRSDKEIEDEDAFASVAEYSKELTFPDSLNMMDAEAVIKSFSDYMEYVQTMTKRDFQDVLTRAKANPEGTAKYWCGWVMQNAMKSDSDDPFQDPPEPKIQDNGNSEDYNPPADENIVGKTDEGYEVGEEKPTLNSLGFKPNHRRNDFRGWLRSVKDEIPNLSPAEYKTLVDKWHRIFKDGESFPFPQHQVQIEFPGKSPRQALVEVRRQFPDEAAKAQKFRGFGQVVSSDDAAQIWMDDIKTLVEGGKLKK
jgi:hypothetical protein